MLALSFLVMIGFSLVAEGWGLHISKGYIYAAMGFSVLVEVLNLQVSKRRKKAIDPVQLRPDLEVRGKKPITNEASPAFKTLDFPRWFKNQIVRPPCAGLKPSAHRRKYPSGTDLGGRHAFVVQRTCGVSAGCFSSRHFGRSYFRKHLN